MTEASTSRIDDHTLESLLVELISGRELIDSTGKVFAALGRDSRAALSWFRSNRNVWTGPNRSDFVHSIIEALATEPPISPRSAPTSTNATPPRYRLSKVRINRFGGLHEFGDPASETKSIELDLAPENYQSTFLYGRNGCGKSSFLSAICWCLTGWFYRPQGVPANSSELVEYYTAPDSDSSPSSTAAKLKALPILPMPSAATLSLIAKTKAPIDTWVEIELKDDVGTTYGPFRRTATLRNGKITESVSGSLASLGISPADFEVGTRLPAMLPHIRLDEKSGLGEAVARLIDIQPLTDVARHAEAAISKIRTDFIKDAIEAAGSIKTKLAQAIVEFRELLLQVELLGLPPSAVESLQSKTEESLSEIEPVIEANRGSRLSRAREILGADIDFADPAIQKEFIRSVTLAAHYMDDQQIDSLAEAKNWDALVSLPAKELDRAASAVDAILREADDLANLQREPDRARRVQLYAKVAAWLKGADEPVSSFCPLCGETLANRIDGVTGLSVRAHLDECIQRDSDAWEQAPQKWAASHIANLSSNLPAPLTQDSGTPPPEQFVLALVEALRSSPPFSTVLRPLIDNLVTQQEEVLKLLPQAPRVPALQLPEALGDIRRELERIINNISANIKYADWIRGVGLTRRYIKDLVLGTRPKELVTRTSLDDAIHALAATAQDSHPLTVLVGKITDIRQAMKNEAAILSKRASLDRAADALRPLGDLRQLVTQQVSGLLRGLKDLQSQWLDRIYTSARLERPAIGKANLTADGKLGFEALHMGTAASAHQVSNASHLRATLVAFWLAYWQHQLQSKGGLRLMLLDDPQDFFDDENQQQFARGLTHVVKADAQVLLCTNKRMFLHDIEWKKIRARRWEIDWRPGVPTIQLLPYREAIDERLASYQRDKTDIEAVCLAAVVRVFAESRLVALFRHQRPHSLGDEPTFMTVVTAIRRLNKSGTRPFEGAPVTKLLEHDGCIPSSPLYELMNDSHHARENLITFGRVEKLLNDIESFVRSVDSVWEHCQNSKLLTAPELVKRKGRAPKPDTPRAMRAPDVGVPMLTAVAAAGADVPAEEAESTGHFSWDSVGDVTVYRILSDSLGLAAPKFCRVIVALDGREIADHSLVICLRGDTTLARRLSRVASQPEVVLLSSESLDPRGRAPVEVEFLDDVQLLPVIGVVWDFDLRGAKKKGEAVLDADYDLQNLKIEVAQPVKGQSGEPLVLSGQVVLLGEEIPWQNIGLHVDEAVSIELQDNTQYLKVVSNTTVDRQNQVRVMNPLGGLGEPKIVRGPASSASSTFSTIPEVLRTRRMWVVLY